MSRATSFHLSLSTCGPFALLLGLSAALGCHGRSATSPASPAPVVAATPPPPPSPAAAPFTLADRLSREATQRPASALRPEDVKEELSRAGITLDGWQQVLGSTVGASFCMAGHTARGLGVALCEYPDTATASRGLAYSHDTFDRLIPHRQLALRRSTLLTVAPPPGSAGAPEEARQITAAFAAL